MLATMPLGAYVEVCGPRGSFSYKNGDKASLGIASWGGQNREVTRIVMIGAGSGITPMLQIASGILSNTDDKTQIIMICAHRSVPEIISMDLLNTWATNHSTKFTVSLLEMMSIYFVI